MKGKNPDYFKESENKKGEVQRRSFFLEIRKKLGSPKIIERDLHNSVIINISYQVYNFTSNLYKAIFLKRPLI